MDIYKPSWQRPEVNIIEAHLKKPNRGVGSEGSVATGASSPCLAFSGGPLCSIHGE